MGTVEEAVKAGKLSKHRLDGIELAVQITELVHFLGHRDINLTHQVYGHLLPSAAKRAVAALDAEFAEWSSS